MYPNEQTYLVTQSNYFSFKSLVFFLQYLNCSNVLAQFVVWYGAFLVLHRKHSEYDHTQPVGLWDVEHELKQLSICSYVVSACVCLSTWVASWTVSVFTTLKSNFSLLK